MRSAFSPNTGSNPVCASLRYTRTACRVALLAGLALAAPVGCGGGGGSSTRYDTTATGECLSGLPRTIVAQTQTTSVNVFIGESEDAAKQEFDKRARFLQNQPQLLEQVLQRRENALLTWDRRATQKLRNTVLGCLREKAA